MSDLMMWSALAGALLPPAVAVANQPRWPGWARLAMTVVACLAAGAGTAEFSGQLSGQRWARAALIIAFTALGTYHAAWKPSGVAPRIEAATSRGRHAATR